MTRNRFFLCLVSSLYLILVSSRLAFEIRSGWIKGGDAESIISSRFDPRGREVVDGVLRKKESLSFKNRSRKIFVSLSDFLGLRALDRSYTWLELLQGVHNESSYEGDFSWVFSKLDYLIGLTPSTDNPPWSRLSPFYFLVYKDGAGSTFLMNTMVNKAPGSWKIWFWSGYHALENLKMKTLAGDLYRHAALMPSSPTFLGPLSYRLSNQEIFDRMPHPQKIIEEELPEELLRKIKLERPEWLK